MKVDIFIPCFIDQVFPQTGMNMVKILEKLDIEVNYNPNQTCCGQMAFNSGFWDEAKDLGEKFLEDFPNDRPVVAPSASCVGYVRNNYEKLFFNTASHIKYNRLKKNIFELTDFLVNVLKVTDLGATFNHKVTYHDSCAALREYGIKNEPRELLKHVKGLELIEMKDTDVCCGFGGTFSVKNEAISTAMADQKVHNALETKAEYIISTDSSCLMHQEGYIKKHNKPIKVAHIADVLASGW
ncbi:MAG: Fe-S oxidoreductase [Bacteroidetes bacterium]|nr:MAG: Fe-S oxidoreductase [Bacteroidota bacterium]